MYRALLLGIFILLPNFTYAGNWYTNCKNAFLSVLGFEVSIPKTPEEILVRYPQIEGNADVVRKFSWSSDSPPVRPLESRYGPSSLDTGLIKTSWGYFRLTFTGTGDEISFACLPLDGPVPTSLILSTQRRFNSLNDLTKEERDTGRWVREGGVDIVFNGGNKLFLRGSANTILPIVRQILKSEE